MKNTIVKAGLAAVLLTVAQPGWAVPILSFTSAQSDIEQTYQLGDTISLGVWISGLDPAAGDALGDYSFIPPSAVETSSHGVDLDGVALAFDLSDQPPVWVPAC